MNRPLLACLLALLTSACGLGVPSGTEVDRHATLTIVQPRQLQSVAHRWLASDIYEYDATLQVWDGNTFINLAPAVTLVLPQTGTPTLQGVFDNLKEGYLYRAVVLARGNPGGSSPLTVLNTQTFTAALFDFRGTQDVPGALVQTVQVALDPMPFSAAATVEPQYLPLNTQQLDLTLIRDGTSIYTQSYPASQPLTLNNLQVGPSYQVQLVARDASSNALGTALSDTLRFDPNGEDLEQAVSLPVAFATPAAIHGSIQ